MLNNELAGIKININTTRERTINPHAVADEFDIPRKNLSSGAAVESDILVSQDPSDVNNLSLPHTARDKKTRKRRLHRKDTRDDAEEKVERRESVQPTDTGEERRKQEMKYAYCIRTCMYIILVTALVALLSAITIILLSALCSIPMQTPTCWFESNISAKSTNCIITKIDDNILEINYQPTSRGRHQLHIKVEGEHIKGSPFPVTVKPPVSDTPIKTIPGLKNPWGVAVNKKGEILVAESDGHCISIFSPTGDKLDSFGSRGSEYGQFNEPCGVAVDDDGNILVADSGNHRIQKFTSDYKHNKTATCTSSTHLNPTSISISPITKKITMSDWNKRQVQILHPDLKFDDCHSIGSTGSVNGRPHDVAFDSAGNMYVTNVNNSIQVFTPEGQFLRLMFGDGELNFPTGISIDSEDIMYVIEHRNHRISLFTLEEEFLASFGGYGGGPGQFDSPWGITVDKNGTIYVSDSGNDRLQIF